MAKVRRSAKSGRFVNKSESEANPDSTYVDTVNKYEFLGWFDVYVDGKKIAVCQYEADAETLQDSYSGEDLGVEIKQR